MTMYKEVYEAMVQISVVIKLDNEVMVNRDGKVVQSEVLAFGRKTKYLLLHPELVLFIDEVGDNTSQKNDRNVGGQKFLVQNDQRALIQSLYANSHFTALGFMTASGKPVCCVIILSKQ